MKRKSDEFLGRLFLCMSSIWALVIVLPNFDGNNSNEFSFYIIPRLIFNL